MANLGVVSPQKSFGPLLQPGNVAIIMISISESHVWPFTAMLFINQSTHFSRHYKVTGVIMSSACHSYCYQSIE